MSIRPESRPSKSTLQLLRRCYRFVSEEWQRATRESLPDEGFEQRFRESCLRSLPHWSISGHREMQLSEGRETASGVLHEIDIVARHADVTGALELKNRRGALPGKNDVIVFFAKILDYLTANPILASKDVCLVFVASGSYEPSGLAACLGLGIHPVGSDIRPVPILVNNAMIMDREIRSGLRIPQNTQDRFEDLCAGLNNLSSTLSETWLDSRCGYLSDDRILIKAVRPLRTLGLAQQIRDLNGVCTDVLNDFRIAKRANEDLKL